MRLAEIGISTFKKADTELYGEGQEEEFPSKAWIDLDKVSSVWSDPDKGKICIYLGSPKESYWTDSYTLNEFVKLWENGCSISRLEGMHKILG